MKPRHGIAKRQKLRVPKPSSATILRLMFAGVALLWIIGLAVIYIHHSVSIHEFLNLQQAIPATQSVFGFSEYLSAFALLLVIIAVSDFKYQFRLHVTAANHRLIALFLSFAVGFAIILIDAWFLNRWPVPQLLNAPNNLKLCLAACVLLVICILAYVSFVSPPRFGRLNGGAVFRAVHHFVGRGNPEQLVVVADWLGSAADDIVRSAARRGPQNHSRGGQLALGHKDYAAYVLSLLGGKKICREMVDKSPWSVAEVFAAASNHLYSSLPITEFARNVGTELVLNPQSPLHSEAEGYSSGFLGYTKPITKAVYGSYELVEELASRGGCPFDIDVELSLDMTPVQLNAYTRAFLIFSESYFSQQYPHHSYAFERAIHNLEMIGHRLHRLNGAEGHYNTAEFRCLKVVVNFIRELIKLLEKRRVPQKRKIVENEPLDGLEAIYVRLARLIIQLIEGAGQVKGPVWTSWEVQHNALWADLFSFNDSASSRLLKFHLRRLIYEEINRMDKYVNFVSAGVIGYCWNVLGISTERSVSKRDREFDPIRRVALKWAKSNYVALVDEYPAVAQACLMGSITFDPAEKRLVETYSGFLGKEGKVKAFALQ